MTERTNPDPSDAEVEEMVRESATRIRKWLPSSWELEEAYNDLLFLARTLAEEEGDPVPTPDDGEGSDKRDLHAAVHVAGKRLQTVGDGLLAADTGDQGMLALLRERSMEAARLLWSIESETPHAAQPSGWRDLTNTLYSIGPLIMAVEHAMEDPDAVVCRGVSERWYTSAAAARDTGQAMIEWAERNAPKEVAHV